MAISQVTLRGRITLPNNVAAEISSVSFTLTGTDFENDEIVPQYTVPAAREAGGIFSVTLWPNDQGDKGSTRWRMNVVLQGGAKVEKMNDLLVKLSDNGRNVSDLILEQTVLVPGFVNRVVTQSEYDGLNAYAPNTIYLVKVS